MKKPMIEDLTGQKFGRLTVLREGKRRGYKGYRRYWWCECKCGVVKEYGQSHLKSGWSKSCGCYKRERSSEVHKKDITGQRFGRLVALKSRGIDNWGKYVWLCQCDCGKTKKVGLSELVSGNTTSCGCFKKDYLREKNTIDITGQRFGRLVALKYTKDSSRGPLWLCQCDCGEKKEVNKYDLLAGDTTSCGCYCKERWKGSKNPKYNPDRWMIPLSSQIRHSKENQKWRDDVIERENGLSQISKKKANTVHHDPSLEDLIHYYSITTLEEALKCKAFFDKKKGVLITKKEHEWIHSRENTEKLYLDYSLRKFITKNLKNKKVASKGATEIKDLTVVCITGQIAGTTKTLFTKKIEPKGCRVVTTWSSRVDVLIAEKPSTTKKYQGAIHDHVEIMTGAEFLEIFA